MTLAYTPSPPPLRPPTVAAAMPPSATSNPPGEAQSRRFKRTCPECGTEHLAAKRSTEFCCDAHRKAWNNRRLTRGALVLDLFVALRNDRKRATALGVWKALCRLAQTFREEDERDRGGRKSWRDPADVLADNPWLKADVIARDMRWKRPDVR